MAGLFEQFATNRKEEVEGVLVAFGGDAKFRITRRHRSNKKWRAMFDKESKPYTHALKTDTLDPEIDEDITRKVFCHTILIGWQGVKNENKLFDANSSEDTDVPYTPENAILLMKALADLYDALNDAAGKASTFREAQLKDDAKN